MQWGGQGPDLVAPGGGGQAARLFLCYPLYIRFLSSESKGLQVLFHFSSPYSGTLAFLLLPPFKIIS